MTTKNQGYLVEFIDPVAGNTYYECGYTEYKQILRDTPWNEVKDRTNCDVSWEEYTNDCHDYMLHSTI